MVQHAAELAELKERLQALQQSFFLRWVSSLGFRGYSWVEFFWGLTVSKLQLSPQSPGLTSHRDSRGSRTFLGMRLNTSRTLYGSLSEELVA